MKCIFAGLMVAACLAAQVGGEAESRNNLAATLMALQSGRDAAQADKLAAQLQAALEKGHAASSTTVARFSRELTASLAGRTLPRAAAPQISAEIVTVMRSAGVATYKYKEAVERFELALSGAGVNADAARKATRALALIASEVRGPEDQDVAALR